MTDDSSQSCPNSSPYPQSGHFPEYLLSLLGKQKQIVNLTINASSPQNYNFNLYDRKEK